MMQKTEPLASGADDIGRNLLVVANRFEVPAAAGSLNYLRPLSRISDVVRVVKPGYTALATAFLRISGPQMLLASVDKEE
jgi:hypothetical protein